MQMLYVGVQRLPVGSAGFPCTIANAVQAVVANDNMTPQCVGVVRSYAQKTGLRVEVGRGARVTGADKLSPMRPGSTEVLSKITRDSRWPYRLPRLEYGRFGLNLSVPLPVPWTCDKASAACSSNATGLR